MFKISKTTSYLWPVEINMPTDGGSFSKEKFDAEFKRISQTRLAEIQKDVAEGKATDESFVREILVGWKGIKDGDDDFEYSQGNLDRLLDIPGVATGIATAALESLSGVRRKN